MIKTIIAGKTLGLTISDCCKLMKMTVNHYKVAGKDIYNQGYYCRSRNYRPIDGGQPCHCDVYYLSFDGNIKTLCYNTTYHRTLILIKALKNGSINRVHPEIIDNYAHNGYNTRSGLFRSDKKLKRIKKIAKSHADYMGCESFNSQIDHSNRVKLRS